jgi:hypothetical protein
MRHRPFHAIVIVGAASGCSSSAVVSNPAPDASSDTTAETANDTAATDSSPASDVADTATADALEDVCVDEGCGCFPCIR